MRNLLGMTLEETSALVAELGMPRFTAKQIVQWVYQKNVSSIDEMTNISQKNRQLLKEHCQIGKAAYQERHESLDGTAKYLFPTEDRQSVEAVWIPDGERGTLCVSCQVGCRMGCRFCMTGRQGFQGNCTVTDILNQIYSLPEFSMLTNIVYMGQGEPMDNLDAVLRSTQLLMAEYGMAWSPRRITVSSVGVREGLKRFIQESPCHLAISLHNPFHDQRHEMMPAEGGTTLEEVLELLKKEGDWAHQRRLSFEYIVFGGLNDSPRHAKELVRLLSPLPCRVNLIRFHTIPNTEFKGASEETMVWLRDFLTMHKITTTIRASRGEDIWAACGLLNTKNQI